MLDLVLVVLLVVAGVVGFRMGFVARATSWAGMLIGLVLAARLMPRVIEALGDSANRLLLVTVAAGLLLAGTYGGQAIGAMIGHRAKGQISSPTVHHLDRAGGAAAGILGLLLVVWLLVPALADVSGWQAREVRRSRIVTTLTDVLPAAPDATETLRQLLGDGYPQVFDGLERAPDVGPPPTSVGFDEETVAEVSRSIVKVTGGACGRVQEGTGFVVDGGLIVTNAHVVAGEDETTVVRSDGAWAEAEVVAFDPVRDVAVLRSVSLDAPPLALGTSAVGQRGAVFGHPGGGPLELSPFVTRRRITAIGRDIYGSPGATRDVLVLAADLAPGDSGSPLVDTTGTVVGLAFAIAPDRDGVAYAVSDEEVRAVLDTVDGSLVSTGGCAS